MENHGIQACAAVIFGSTFLSWADAIWQFLGQNNAAITSVVAISSLIVMVIRKGKKT